MLKVLKHIFFRTIFLYLIAGSLIFFLADKDRFWNHVATSALSRYMPDYDYLIAFNHDRQKFDIQKNKEFERYFRKVAQFMPLLPEAHAMLGFCYFFDGDLAKAQKSYEDAVHVYPKVFNFHYNLGIIALKQQNPTQALEHFKKSIEVIPVENIQYVVNSRMYNPFLPFAHQPDALAAAMGEYTHEVYRQAYLQILIISETKRDYKTMLVYARRAFASGFLEKETAYYYMSRATVAVPERKMEIKQELLIY